MNPLNANITNEEFRTLRNRLINETPNFYKDKSVIRNPNTFNNLTDNFANININNAIRNDNTYNTNGSNNITDIANSRGDFYDSKADIQSKNKLNPNMSQQESNYLNNYSGEDNTKTDTSNQDDSNEQNITIGDYENPILEKIINRSINKENEFKIIITNITSYIIINLIIKFIRFFFNYTKSGKTLLSFLSQYSINNKSTIIKTNDFKNNGNFINFINLIKVKLYDWDLIEKIFNWENIIFFIKLIVTLNILIAIIKLLRRISYNDLNLNLRQRSLLGLNENSLKLNYYNNSKIDRKPHLILTNDDRFIDKNNLESIVDINKNRSATPFLFKSLKTPLSNSKYNVTDNLKDNSISYNRYANRNMFGLNNDNTNFNKSINGTVSNFKNDRVNSSNTNKGYVPSNKYVYMMNSPSPIKKM